MRQQFELVYYGKFTYEATELLSVFERMWMYRHLSDTKKQEIEDMEKARDEAKQKAAQANSHRVYRRK